MEKTVKAKEQKEKSKTIPATDLPYRMYIVWVSEDEVAIVRAHDTVEATVKAEKQGYKTIGRVDYIEWADKYKCASDIPDTLLAANGIQPRCHKCGNLIDIDNVHTKHGRAFCEKCIQKAK